MSKTLPLAVISIIIIIIVLPATLARGCRGVHAPPQEIDRSPIISPAGEQAIKVYLHEEGKTVSMSLEEYLVGVVAAEMPASFELEALKAQAVVARTYVARQLPAFGGTGCSDTPGADVCTNPAHCQAWDTESRILARWEEKDAVGYLNKIRRAVRETAGLIITHDNLPVEAVYHSTCGGHTEDSENVWSNALPYLRGVPCPYCESSRWRQTRHTFTSAEFSAAVLPLVSVVPVSAAGTPLLSSADRSPSGRVNTLKVAGQTVSGRDLRGALNLPSTNFTWQTEGGKITFTVKGYGHGVGLCQYGADGMAKSGHDFGEILRYYYTGIELESLAAFTHR